MTMTSLLQSLAREGIRLRAEGGALKASAERGRLTPELQDGIKRFKRELLQWLQDASPADAGLEAVVPDAAGLHEPFPLSDLQSGFYLADDPFMEYHVRPHYYAEMNRVDFDLARYEAAWNKALERHRKEIALVEPDGRLRILAETPRVKYVLHDLRDRSAAEAQRHLAAVRARLMRKEQPLDRWPFFDLEITLWTEDGVSKARIHYNNNNFFFDGFGSNLFTAEIDRYYREPDLELPPIELSYRDAVLGLDRLAASDSGQASRRYWEDRIPGFPPPPELPQVPGLERRVRSRLQRRELLLPKETWHGFKANASRHGLTPSNAVIAAYAELLCAWSNSRHFILSNMMTRRLPIHPNIKDILGNFATLYPLEVDFRERVPFHVQARRLQERVLQDAAHRYWGGMQVMQALNRARGEAGRAPCPFVIGSGIFMEGFPKFDFSCLETSQVLFDNQFWELSDGRLYIVWDLLEEFFPPGMIDSMHRAYGAFIRRLGQDESAWSETEMPLLPEEDLQARELRNATAAPVPETLLHEALGFFAERDGAKPAVVSPGSRLDYRGLSDRAGAVAAELAARGAARGERIAILADRGPDLAAAALGILAAGAAYVPVDPALPPERKRYLLANSGCRFAWVAPKYLGPEPLAEGVASLALSEAALRRAPAAPGRKRGDPGDLAYIIYTSGSTGAPKGVMIDHRGAMNTIADINSRFGVDGKDVLFGVSSFSFDLSVYDVFGAVAAGATLVYPDPASAMNPAHWLELAVAHKVSVWNSVPALMSLLVDTARRQGAALPALRLVMLSGDWIPVDLPRAIREVAPNARIVSLGGATEASIWSIYYPVDDLDAHRVSIPYGYPLANQTWHVLDSLGRPAPTWTPGELCIGGIGLALGYMGDPAKTAERFFTHPVSGERLYRTGDRGRYLRDGCLEFLGRIDFQVKIQGYRIELGEIEAALLEHPAIKEAVVAAVGAEAGARQLAAYLVPAPGSSVTPEELSEFLRRKLPAYMVPARWAIVAALPLTANGKVDRKALPSLEAAGAGSAAKAERPPAIPPRNETEKALLAIWSQVLGRGDIGMRDDYFDLGGHSFGAVRILAMVKERFGASLSLGDIFQGRTLEHLALRVAGGNAPGARTAPAGPVAIKAKGRGEPLFLVHPAGGHVIGYRELAARLDCPVYGFQARGVEGEAEPSGDVAEMAAEYVRQLRAFKPHGPYTLGGWSSGAMIAFAMAAKLEAEGEAVDSVVSIDGPTPFRHAKLEDTRLLLWFLEDLALGLPLAGLESHAWKSTDPSEALAEALALLDPAGTKGLDAAHLAPVFAVFRGVVRAGSAYAAPSIAADMLVVRARDGAVGEFGAHPHLAEGDWGWSRFTSGRVASRALPGTHHTLMAPPCVDALASAVSEALPNRPQVNHNTHKD